jgi:tRNA G10  N-methylase Trm11
MENKQTAVKWLEEEFIKLEQTTGVYGVMYELIEKAKEIENNQMEELKDFEKWKEWKNKPQ